MLKGTIFIVTGMLLSSREISMKMSLTMFVIFFVCGCFLKGIALSVIRALFCIFLFITVLNIKLKDKPIYAILRKISTIMYFIHLYVWTFYYIIVYKEKTYGLDNFFITVCVSIAISIIYIFIKESRKIKVKEKINKHLHIVFGDEHYNPLGIIRSLGEEGIRPIAIIIKNQRQIASKSKYISKLHIVNTMEDGYRLLLDKYGNEENKPFLYTSDDKLTNFLDNNYNELKDKFYFFNAGKTNGISEFMDKENIIKLASKHGLNIAKTWTVTPGEIPDDIQYPIITKAIISTLDNWKDDVFICNNENELKEAFKHIRSKKVLLQQYIQKKNELCIDGYSVSHGEKVFYAIASKYNYIIEGSYSHYMTVKNCKNKELEDKLSAMFKEIGFEGIFSIEFLIDNYDRLYFLEINFRNSTWSYASTKAKMNLPILWAEAMLDSSIVDKSYNEITKEFTAMVEPDDFRNRVKTHKISLFKWIKEVFECRCLYYFSIRDIKPAVGIVTSKIKRKRLNKNESK